MDLALILRDYGWVAVLAFFLIDRVWPFAANATNAQEEHKRKITMLQAERALVLDERYFNLLVQLTNELKAQVVALETQLDSSSAQLATDYHTSLSNVNATLLSVQTDLRTILQSIHTLATDKG